MTRECLRCHNQFRVFPNRIKRELNKYCSSDCQNPPIIVTCSTCHNDFRVWPSKVVTRKYCSIECRNIAYEKAVKTTCQNCHKAFKVKLSQLKLGKGKYCSYKCRGEAFIGIAGKWNIGKRAVWNMGAKNHGWRGGITSLYKQIKNSIEWRQWRQAIFQRDDYTCQFCGRQGVSLQADHIRPIALLLVEYHIETLDQAPACQELWRLKNGRTLCIPCHKRTDTFGYKTKKIINAYKSIR